MTDAMQEGKKAATPAMHKLLEEAKRQRLVGRLRSGLSPMRAGHRNVPAKKVDALMSEAADEIERLRGALTYLMNAFDFEVHQCERCGEADPMNDCDSAVWLRDFLKPNAQVKGTTERSEGVPLEPLVGRRRTHEN